MADHHELQTHQNNVNPEEDMDQPSKGSRSCFKENALLILLIASMAAGIGLGAGLRYVEPPFDPGQITYLRFPGDLLMRMLKMLILPLIVSSLISGLAELKAPGMLGLRAVVYYLTTTLLAVILGVILVVTIKPGQGTTKENNSTAATINVNPADSLLDLIRNMFPDNLVTACFQQTRSILYGVNTTSVNQTANISSVSTRYYPTETTVTGMNVMGIVVFSIALGITISKMEEEGRPLASFFNSLNGAIMRLIHAVIWYSPIGILFLVAAKVVEMDDIGQVLNQLGLYFATVMAGLVIHFWITLPLIFFAATRRNPYRFLLGCLQALVTAFGTSSSSATLPVTFKCLEENLGLDTRVTRFVLPVGATINMDGTALYEAVAAVFIAQVNNMELSFVQIVIICITATAAAIGAAGVPQAGLITMVIVLTAVGLPTEDITIILTIDWLLDRFRTLTNVWGDALGAGIVYHRSQKELSEMDSLKPIPNSATDFANISVETPAHEESTSWHDNKGYTDDTNGVALVGHRRM